MTTRQLPDVVLIGPYGAGKTTLGKLLAKRLDWLYRSVDDELDRILRALFDHSHVERFYPLPMNSPQRQPYNASVVEAFLDETTKISKGAVLDFGFVYTIYEDGEELNRVKRALDAYPNVFLIRPSPDDNESLQILIERKRKQMGDDAQISRLIRYSLESPSTRTLAKFVIYTMGKSPEEVCDEICQQAGLLG